MKKAFVSFVLLAALSGLVFPAQDDVMRIPGDARQVGELLSDTYSGETILLVKISSEIELDAALWVQARDGSWAERVEPAHVFGSYVVIKKKLKNEYLIGSRLYQ